MKLTTKPEPYSSERALHWFSHQVAPALKLALRLGKMNHTQIVHDIITHAKLTEKHEKVLKQQAAAAKEMVLQRRQSQNLRNLTGQKGASTNFGQNLYNWFLSNTQSLMLLAIVVIGLYLEFKRELSKLISFLVVSLIAVGLVFNAEDVENILLEPFNRITGVQKKTYHISVMEQALITPWWRSTRGLGSVTPQATQQGKDVLPIEEMRIYILSTTRFYHEGFEEYPGAWFFCPVDLEEIRERLRVQNEGEIEIEDYELPFPLEGSTRLREINALCRIIQKTQGTPLCYEMDVIQKWWFHSFTEFIDNRDHIRCYPMQGGEFLVRYLVQETQIFGEMHPDLMSHISYTTIGRKLETNKSYLSTDNDTFSYRWREVGELGGNADLHYQPRKIQ